MSKILVLNAGSSSVKYKLFHMDTKSVLASGLIERIGETDIKNHREALVSIEYRLKSLNILTDWNELSAIGHRVVHGGEEFHEPTLINEYVLKKIDQLSSLAPLHNPANLLGIEIALQLAPNVAQVAIFDTAFHQTIPDYAYMYALPYEMYEKHGIRRYGFHGTSHQYVASQAAHFLNKDISECNFITLHLGNGSSAAAIKKGKSIDTSMGMTPLEGLIMGTRSGDLDPQIIIYLSKQLGLSIDEIDQLLNKKSGLLGISGKIDMRTIQDSTDHKSLLAIDMLAHRLIKYIGAYYIQLGHVDAIIFTGGIGEHSSLIRDKVCRSITKPLNIHYLEDKNKNVQADSIVSLTDEDSKTDILVIPTDEELQIALQTVTKLKGIT